MKRRNMKIFILYITYYYIHKCRFDEKARLNALQMM